jgi:hypothetical protein
MYSDNTRIAKDWQMMCHIFEEIWPYRVIDSKIQVIDMLFSRPYSYASLRLKFQISTCERAYSLRAVWTVEEVFSLLYCSHNEILKFLSASSKIPQIFSKFLK